MNLWNQLLGLWKAPRLAGPAAALYEAVVRQARQPAFYAECGVADTLDGRFDMIVLHAVLVIARLQPHAGLPRELAQALFDHLFTDMDHSLREIGAGDMGIAPRIKKMARAFYGRAQAYQEGLAQGDAALSEALLRNLFRGEDPGAPRRTALTAYVRREHDALSRQSLDRFLAGEVQFGPPPSPGSA
ncbi:MAG: ubiquinol-cytochrome C chaperone [Alphaproteobacteria bacterium]|nr:ubiquinol-cytochrome C chaperone [Alphaproteobacteria bacterium]